MFCKACNLSQVRFLILVLLLIIYQNQEVAAQSKKTTQQGFTKLNRAYQTGELLEKEYLSNAISLTSKCWESGIHFTTDELTDLLSLYKKLAWSKKEFGDARLDYYNAFINNASVADQTGAAMYYADKRSQVSKQNGDGFSLTTDYLKIQIFAEQELYHKVISIYEADQAYIDSLPGLLRNEQIGFVEGMNAVSMLSEVIDAYVETGDTASLYRTAKLAEGVGMALKSLYPISRQSMLGNDFYMLFIKYQIAKFEGRQNDIGLLLDSMQRLKNIYTDQAAVYIDCMTYEARIEYYISQKNYDSAHLYISRFESLPILAGNQKALILEYRARLQAMLGDFYGSSNFMASALLSERQEKLALMNEMNKLMYAYTEAENAKIDLQHSERAKKQSALWLVIISAFAILLLSTIYMIMSYRNKKAKALIRALNEAANVQVIAMEEAKHEIIREEQQRLGQDLHDSLSSSIAAIKYQLEELVMDADDPGLKNRLSKLQAETTSAYEAVRTKSHDWYTISDKKSEFIFEKQIKQLVDSALPESRYTSTIHIDEHVIDHTDTDTRIALIRIIQEAATNIIKHAKAKNVEILVYLEADNIVLTIKDDGVGFNVGKNIAKKSTMGLESIRKRVSDMKGATKIVSGSQGTEIVVTLPVNYFHL